MGERFAVIDTETTWGDKVMSIGVVIADCCSFAAEGKSYYILTPYKYHGGMYSGALYAGGVVPDLEGKREEVIARLRGFLEDNGVRDIFAYNALFDFGHLPELNYLNWYDIMKIAAYRQYNRSIPEGAACWKTGRLKTGFGVESVYRMLSGNSSYSEKHNALIDAEDELEIMRMLELEYEGYALARIKQG